MLKVTARLFDNGQLVGYMLNDGISNAKFLKQQVWELAKNKQIIDVIASGTIDEPIISGTNGFELKKLPELSIKTPTRINEDIKSTDLFASLVRLHLSNDFNTINELIQTKTTKVISLDNLKNEASSGKFNISTKNNLSMYFEIIHSVGDGVVNGIRVARPVGHELERQKEEFNSSKNYALHCNKELKDILNDLSEQMYRAKAQYNSNEVPYNSVEDALDNYVRYTKTISTEHSSDTKETIDKLDNIIRRGQRYEVINIIEVINTVDEILDSLGKETLRVIESGFYPKLMIDQSSRIAGYVVRYTGNSPINTFRFQVSPEHKLIPYTIQPNETICLSRAELAILGSNQLINCVFKNGRLMSGSIKQFNSLNEFLSNSYVKFEDSYGAELSQHDPELKVELQSVADEATINTYFANPRLNRIKLSSKQKVSDLNKSDKSSRPENFTKEVVSKGMFNAFKR